MKKILFLLLVLFFACPILVLAEQIDINSATLSQLDTLTGIGPKYAQAIADARPYSSVDDLLKVKGIGPKTLQKIKDQGIACVDCLTKIETPAQSPADNTATQQPSNITYPGGVFINEIMPDPKGPDETDEWIELYNSSNFDVDLSRWQIQDTKGTITTYIIPAGTKILANNFLVFKRPDTKIMLNNDSDGLNLLTPDGKITDSMSFTKALLGQSYNKTNLGWAWSTTLTPGAKNIITAVSSTKNNTTNLPKTKKSDNNIVETGVADLSQGATNQEEITAKNPWFLFFIALAITIISAIVVLILKLKFQKNVRT